MRISLVWLCFVVSLFLLFAGCGQGPSPRLRALYGTQGFQPQPPHSVWPQLDRVGLIVHSDTTGPNAAPAISPQFLETLNRRTEEFVARRCLVPAAVLLTFRPSIQQAQIKQKLISLGHEHGISHILLVVLSSREQSGPATLGGERMMTQMSGISVENVALSEVALLRLADYLVIWNLTGSATETLELLDAPIGKDQPTREQSLEILRAQAAQQALDRSLHFLGSWCEDIPKKAGRNSSPI